MYYIADTGIYSLSRRDKKKKVKMIHSVLFEKGSKVCHVHSLETGEQMFTSQVMYLGIDDQSWMSWPKVMSDTDKFFAM